MKRKLAQTYRNILAFLGKNLLLMTVSDKRFTIFSNDCYGGEIYKHMGLEYNTPFVGLMLMAPCYISFLENPPFYINQPLEFVTISKYKELNTFRAYKNFYPIGKLGDLEIHFLHYSSKEEACDKWNRRKKRINWDNLRIKFSMDKDYSTEELLKRFSRLNYLHKLSISQRPYSWFDRNIVLKNYSSDGAVAFIRSLAEFNLVGWLNGNSLQFSNNFQRILGSLLQSVLKR